VGALAGSNDVRQAKHGVLDEGVVRTRLGFHAFRRATTAGHDSIVVVVVVAVAAVVAAAAAATCVVWRWLRVSRRGIQCERGPSHHDGIHHIPKTCRKGKPVSEYSRHGVSQTSHSGARNSIILHGGPKHGKCNGPQEREP